MRQEINLDGDAAHAFLDLPVPGGEQSVTPRSEAQVRRMRNVCLLGEVGRGLQVCVVRSEVVLDILEVVDVLQFWHPCKQHL